MSANVLDKSIASILMVTKQKTTVGIYICNHCQIMSEDDKDYL
jgi:hypothetical protein